MDYMSSMHSTKHGNDCVFVVVNQFSKMAILVPCKYSIIAEVVAKLFFKHVWVRFGLPQAIISKRNNRFLDTF